MKNKRVPYFDIAKGLLIIFVVWGHSDNNIVANGFDISKYEAISDACFSPLFSVILPFYMPAFFFITGCCSNFEKGVKDFISSRVKTMLLPMFVFCYLPFLMVYAVKGSGKLISMLYEVLSGGKWFIAALFCSELLFFFINRSITRDRTKQLTICSVMFIIGALLHCSGIVNPRHDFWGLNHSLLLTIMIPLGMVMKDKIGKLSLFASMTCFLLVYIATRCFVGDEIPFITNNIQMQYLTIFPLFVMAISGSVFIVSLCKMIGRLSILEFIGRHTLIIFFLHGHFFFYNVLLPRIEGSSYTVMSLFWVFSIITAVCIPACISKLLDMKYCRILKGKF